MHEPFIRVDSHCHLLPPRLAAKIRGFFLANGLLASCCPTPQSSSSSDDDQVGHAPSSDTDGAGSAASGLLAYPHEPFEVLQQIIREATPAPNTTAATLRTTIWTLPYAHSHDMSARLNNSMLELAQELNAASEGKVEVLPGCTCHPGDASPLLPHQVVEQAVRRGARMVKLHCSVGSYSVMDDRLSDFWRLCETLRLPVVVHAGVSVAGVTDDDDLRDIDALCSRHSKLPLILAHSGHPSTERALEMTSRHPCLYLDTTPVVTAHVDLPPTSDFAAQVLHLAMTSRILFGSDAPNTAISREDAAANVRRWLRECVSRAMGSLRQEDAHTEMERNIERAEEQVFGGAAIKLMDEVLSVDLLDKQRGKL